MFFRFREKQSYVTMTNSFWVPGVQMSPEDYKRLNITEPDYNLYKEAFNIAAAENVVSGKPLDMGKIASDVDLSEA